ncbi:carbohydrate ABC transporter permease [Ilumatobacter sp.]|uniref:carbohydrate ABC transporter permease n=1 Tax=Ilumatobacter sp. TaxID=1967498 RepID=UPI0037511BF0
MSTPLRSRLAVVASYVILIGALLTALFPLFWIFSTSIKSRVDAFANPPRFVSFEPTAKNYRQLLGDDNFTRIVWNTIQITVASTLLCTTIAAFAAYALARHRRFPGRRPFEATLILVRALPGIILMVPMFQVVTRLGLYDNKLALIVIYATLNMPFAVWLLTGFMDQVPVEVEESARTDGAGRIRLFVFIILPLALPGLAATTIFVGLLSWNEFLVPAILAGEDSKTLPVYISGFVSARTLDWGPLAAASCLAIIPIALFTALIQRQLVSGLSSGAVKE